MFLVTVSLCLREKNQWADPRAARYDVGSVRRKRMRKGHGSDVGDGRGR